MSRESNRSQASCREDDFDSSRERVGSTRVPLCNRKNLILFAAIVTGLAWFTDVGSLEEDTRLRLILGEPGRHAKSLAISADCTRMATTDLDGAQRCATFGAGGGTRGFAIYRVMSGRCRSRRMAGSWLVPVSGPA